MLQPERLRSNWWYLVPIFLGIIGGVIAYFALRNDDPKKAKKCLYLGIILTVIQIIVEVSLFSAGIFDQGYDVNV